MSSQAIAQLQQPSPQQRPSQQHSERSGSGQENAQSQKTPPAPPSPGVTSSQPEVRGRTSAASQSENEDKEGNWLEHFLYDVRITDVLLAVFTLFLAIYTGRLWHATAGLGASAKAANELNRQNMIASQRAWLSITDVKLIAPTTVTEEAITFRVSAMVKNHGQTPALNVAVWFESYFVASKSEKFADAERRFKDKLRLHPVQLGYHLIFPNEGVIQRELWTDGTEKIKASIETRPSGERMAAVIFFIGVSYRIVGDETAHITYRPHHMLNLPVGLAVPQGEWADLSRLGAGEAD